MTPPKKDPAKKAAPKRTRAKRPTPPPAVTSGEPIEQVSPLAEPNPPVPPTAEEVGAMILTLDPKILTLLRDTFNIVLTGGEVTLKLGGSGQ